ncbi:NUDIX hydrolase [Humisphaera borealis]|uniref:Nudix hydrolase domain-containing protein n=1 Tax=Humisphaera borealis TaxID=2807512 RepID=A0A7M2WUC1_9BACT|nr:hypothetical protein [Humisphaera borealis]QOV89053.1 hypothetical protein IPV69_22975 [Humisphaera borealis]
MQSSLSIRVAGDWSSHEVIAHLIESSFAPSNAVQSVIDAAWSAALAVPNRTLFDGPMCRLESFDVSPAGVRIGMSRTSYKSFWGTNVSHPELADQYGPGVLANPIGLSPALLTADGWLLLGRRNERVAYYPGRVHPFSGTLEPDDGSGDGERDAPDVFAAVRRELHEEVRVGASDIVSMRLIGLAEDARLRQPELIFGVETLLSRGQVELQLDQAEHRDVVAIPAEPAAVKAAVQASGVAGEFTPIAIATLLLQGRAAWGEGWFAGANGDAPGILVGR